VGPSIFRSTPSPLNFPSPPVKKKTPAQDIAASTVKNTIRPISILRMVE